MPNVRMEADEVGTADFVPEDLRIGAELARRVNELLSDWERDEPAAIMLADPDEKY